MVLDNIIENHEIPWETKKTPTACHYVKETYTLSMNRGGIKGLNENNNHDEARNAKQGKEGQTPCGVGCCTGAATSLTCPCTS